MYGACSQYLFHATDTTGGEFMIMLPLLLVVLVFGTMSDDILEDIHVAVSQLIYTKSLL